MLLQKDAVTPVARLERKVFAPSALPLYFAPRRFGADPDTLSCQTSFTYLAVDSLGQISPAQATVNVVVRVPGPKILSAELFDPGINDDKADAGDVLLVRFDTPTDQPQNWRGMFEVVNGSLGAARFSVIWSSLGDVLMLVLNGTTHGLQLSNLTQLKFRGPLAVTPILASDNKQTNGSYPCEGLSPPLQGSFGEARCPGPGLVFQFSTASCVTCGEGMYRSAHGLECLPCAPGTFNDQQATDSCQPCIAGQYLPAGASSRSKCLIARPGYYVPRGGMVQQLACPSGMLTENAGSVDCKRCPEGADCQATYPLHSIALPRKAFFRTDKTTIIPCVVPVACTGWNTVALRNECLEGAVGYLCSGCASGWWRPIDRPLAPCELCGDSSSNKWYPVGPLTLAAIFTSALIWVFGALSVNAAVWGHMHAVVLRLGLNYFTAISVLSRLEVWELAPVLGDDHAKTLTQALGVFRFNGGAPAHLTEMECHMGTGSQWEVLKGQTWLWAILPLAWPFALVLLGVISFEFYALSVRLFGPAKRVTPKLKGSLTSAQLETLEAPRVMGLFQSKAARLPLCHRLSITLSDATPLALIGYFVLMPTALRSLVAMMACTEISNEEHPWRLQFAPDVRCLHGDHMLWFVIAVTGVIIWGLIVPVTLLLVMRQVGLEQEGSVKVVLGWASDGYELPFVHWEGLVQLRRSMVVLIAALPGISRTAELALCELVVLLSLLLQC
jgi:hypothetical protein